MTTQLVLASTAFGLATVVAAKRAGLLRPADRYVLVCSNNSAVSHTPPIQITAINTVPGVNRAAMRLLGS